MTTYYHAISGVRFLSATRVDLSGSDNQPLTGFTGDNLIFAIHLYNATSGKNPTSQRFTLEWLNVSDSGSWTSLGNTGELTYNATTDLVDNATLTAPTGWKCSDLGAGYGDVDSIEREGSNAYVPIDLGPDEEVEYHIAVDFSNADKANGDEYQFRLYDSLESVYLDITPHITVAEPAAALEIDTGDNLRHSEQISLTFTGRLSVADLMGMVEQADAFPNPLFSNVADILGISETEAITFLGKISVADLLKMQENTALGFISSLSVSDIMGIVEQAISLPSQLVADVADLLRQSESIDRLLPMLNIISDDDVGISESVEFSSEKAPLTINVFDLMDNGENLV